jgi:precorrin-2 dehydrogenase/sirohydrochlorin ferrochelatase
MKTYPISLVGLEQQRVVVVGGGDVAARKVAGLMEVGAQITVISPALVPELLLLEATERVAVINRAYRDGDLVAAFLVVAATDDPSVNQAVAHEAEQRGCLVNVVDDPMLSNFIVPAVMRRGELTVAISTGGASPALARRLREQLEVLIGPEYAVLADLLAELRPELLTRGEDGEVAKARLGAALRLVDSDLLEVIKKRGRDAARRRALDLLGQSESG